MVRCSTLNPPEAREALRSINLVRQQRNLTALRSLDHSTDPIPLFPLCATSSNDWRPWPDPPQFYSFNGFPELIALSTNGILIWGVQESGFFTLYHLSNLDRTRHEFTFQRVLRSVKPSLRIAEFSFDPSSVL